MKKSKRSEVDPFIVMDVMESARKAEKSGKKIIHMEVGQPGTAAPKLAKDFISKEISKNKLGYTVTLGLPSLRERISKLYAEWYNLDINPDRVVITTGSSGAFILSSISIAVFLLFMRNSITMSHSLLDTITTFFHAPINSAFL